MECKAAVFGDSAPSSPTAEGSQQAGDGLHTFSFGKGSAGTGTGQGQEQLIHPGAAWDKLHLNF